MQSWGTPPCRVWCQTNSCVEAHGEGGHVGIGAPTLFLWDLSSSPLRWVHTDRGIPLRKERGTSQGASGWGIGIGEGLKELPQCAGQSCSERTTEAPGQRGQLPQH